MTAHHWLVHLPLALLLLGAAADLVGAATTSAPMRRWATPLLVAGAAAVLAAFLTGQGAMLMSQARHVADPRLETHAQWGGSAVWPIAAAGALRLAWRNRLTGPSGWVLAGAAALSALLALLIVRSGLLLAHGG
jgi:uncharacterized membrane protein